MSYTCHKCKKPYLLFPSEKICPVCNQDTKRAHENIFIKFHNKVGQEGCLLWSPLNKWCVNFSNAFMYYDCILTCERLVKLIKESE